MTKDEEYKGFWFLPQNIEMKVPGILYFESDKEIRLELIGGFEDKIFDIFTSKSIDIIQGITHKNEKISLFICDRYGSWNLSSAYPITNYKCQYLIKGKHLSNITEEIFDRIQIDLSALYEWYPSGRIRNTIKFSEDDIPIETIFSILDTDYWEKVFKINNEFELIIFGSGWSNINYNHSEFNLFENTLCEIRSLKSKSSFISLWNKVDIFRQFLSLASLSSVKYLHITLFDNDDYQELKNDRKAFNPISLFFIDKKNYKERPKKHELLFTYADLDNKFESIISNWYAFKNNLAPIRNHLISSIQPKDVFTSLDFLIIVQALEGFHRRFIDNKKKDLRARINDLLILFSKVQKISNSPINVTHVVKSRNYYSHFFEINKDVLKGVELFKLTMQLRNLLICCVLYLIDFDIELINKLLNKNDKT